MQLSQLRYVIGSRAAATTLAVDYRGYPPLPLQRIFLKKQADGSAWARQPRPRGGGGRRLATAARPRAA